MFQRDKPVPVWGKANPGSIVEIEFAGQKISTKTDVSGKWRLDLAPMSANSQGASMEVKNGAEVAQIKNILIGEVWICSGQSNMEFAMGWLTKDAKEAKYQPIVELIKNTIAHANDPLLRHIKVERVVSPLKEKTSFNGQWAEVSPRVNPFISATAYFFAKKLRETLNVPVGIVVSAWGGTRVEPWIPMEAYGSNTDLKSYYAKELKSNREKSANFTIEKAQKWHATNMKKWNEAKKKAAAAGKPFKQRKPRMAQDAMLSNRVPSTLFNGMIAPLVPYANRGVIWYQGEANAKHENLNYEKHFRALIQGWRNKWNDDELPFYWCQLAQFQNVRAEPIENDPWVNVCYQQFLALNIPNTGMAVLNDIGEAKDIHPHNKIEAGARLAHWALHQTYGMTEIVPSGPLYKQHQIQGEKVIITFDHIGSGLMVGDKPLLGAPTPSDEPLKCFQIKGEDGKWRWAEAKIISKDQVEVFHSNIAKPTEVRYAWAPNAEGANLYNKEGLPASLFKTVK